MHASEIINFVSFWFSNDIISRRFTNCLIHSNFILNPFHLILILVKFVILRTFKLLFFSLFQAKMFHGIIEDEIIISIAGRIIRILQFVVNIHFMTLLKLKHKKLLGQLNLLKFYFDKQNPFHALKVHQHVQLPVKFTGHSPRMLVLKHLITSLLLGLCCAPFAVIYQIVALLS